MTDNKNLLLKFQLSDVDYHIFIKKMVQLKIKALASRLENIDYYYRESEYNGNHLIEIGLKQPNDSAQYDLVGKITRLDSKDNEGNRQKIDLVGNYVNMTKDDYHEISNHNDLREEPCAVCGAKHKKRRTMYLMLDNTTGDYEYVGSECVQKLMPEWGLDVFRKLFENLIKLQTMFEKDRTTETPKANVIDVLKNTFNDFQKEQTQTKQTSNKDKAVQSLNDNMKYFALYNDVKNGKQHAMLLANRIETYAPNEIRDKAKDIDTNTLNQQLNKCDTLFEKYQKNLSLVQNQYETALNKINSQYGDTNYSFENTIDLIKKNREWPNKPGYNLREEIGAGEIPVTLVKSTKEAYLKFLKAKINKTNNAQELSFNQDVLNKLKALDKKFALANTKIALTMNKLLDFSTITTSHGTNYKNKFSLLPSFKQSSTYPDYVTE